LQQALNQCYTNFKTPKWVSVPKKSYICSTFVRKKKNPSGVVSIQIIDKSRRTYKVYKTIGSSSDTIEIEALFQADKKWIDHHYSQSDMFFLCRIATGSKANYGTFTK